MKQTTCNTVAFLSHCNHQKPSLEIKGTIPTKYAEMIITDWTFGNIVIPEGFDEAGLPYFSDEFYQNRKKEYDKIVKYDEERARNLFWFNIEFVM